MGQMYDIGLQTGKEVTKAVDAFIKSERKGDIPSQNYDPIARKTLSDGTTIYRWYMKWYPSWIDVEKRFLEVLKEFNDEYEDWNRGYKLVAVGDEGDQDERGNDIGFEYFDGLYISNKVTYPEDFEDEKPVTDFKKIAQNAIDAFLTGCELDNDGVLEALEISDEEFTETMGYSLYE